MPDDSKTTSEFLERLRGFSDRELEERLAYVQESLFNLRFRMASGKLRTRSGSASTARPLRGSRPSRRNANWGLTSPRLTRR